MKTEEIIDKLFKHLDNWRHLPAYQLERRADIFFGIYLQEILKKKFNEDIDFIVPEFPVRLGNVYKDKPVKNLTYHLKLTMLLFLKRQIRFI